MNYIDQIEKELLALLTKKPEEFTAPNIKERTPDELLADLCSNIDLCYSWTDIFNVLCRLVPTRAEWFCHGDMLTVSKPDFDSYIGEFHFMSPRYSFSFYDSEINFNRYEDKTFLFVTATRSVLKAEAEVSENIFI